MGLKRYQNNVFLFVLLGIGVVLSHSSVLSGCNNPSNVNGNQQEEPEEPWDWADAPALQFTTQDFKLRQKQALTGDSLSIGFIDFIRPLDSSAGARQKYATLYSESGDKEQIYVFDRPLPGGWLGVLCAVCTKINTVSSDTIIQFNNVVEIIIDTETINLIYKQPLITSPLDTLILVSSIIVVK